MSRVSVLFKYLTETFGKDLGIKILNLSGITAESRAPELSRQILDKIESGTFPDDSPLLVGTCKPAALLSQGLLGIDSLFGEAACAAGHLVVHWVAPGIRVSKKAQELMCGTSLCRLMQQDLDHAKVMTALDRCAQMRCGASSFENLCENFPVYKERSTSLKRCFFLIARVSALYVVAPRPTKPDDAGQPPLDLSGDIGWAAQMYVNRFKPVGNEENSNLKLFLFDNADEHNSDHLNDPDTARRWVFWQGPTSCNGLNFGKWVRFGQDRPMSHRETAGAWKAFPCVPPPRGLYAAMGSRAMQSTNSLHEEAIADMYAALPGNSTHSMSKPPVKGTGKGTRVNNAI
mmetsp:Transcript_5564/g.10213  ORF Transcript_5564/g.10213 Transcript_5564/m.10213 type:complete len:345 (+) Transcript_5564:46-1080(+)